MGLLQNFYAVHILYERSAEQVAYIAAEKAIELAVLGLGDESITILELLAEQSDARGPLIRKIPQEAQFLYNVINKAPHGVGMLDAAELANLQRESLRRIPCLPDYIDIVDGTEEDFKKLQKWAKELESDEKQKWALNSTNGFLVSR
jgi:hypothetical protein